MILRVVLDTNVIVSALMKPGGNEALVLARVFQGQLELCFSPAVFAEYEIVLPRSELKLDSNQVATTLAHIRRIGRVVAPIEQLHISDHEPDNRFYECAAAAGAEYIVTGNIRHFHRSYRKTKIITARQFLDVLAHEANE